MQPFWGLVHAKSGREPVAEEHLRRQGYRPFLPKRSRTIRHARKTREEMRAFFPSYLFVEIDPDATRWRPIHSTTGVIRLVTRGETPVRAPDGLVETMMAAVDDDGLIRMEPQFQAGERVRIVKGPFADQLGMIETLNDRDRVRVLLDMMQSRLAVDVPTAHLAQP